MSGYTVVAVSNLLPYALDPEWDGLRPGEEETWPLPATVRWGDIAAVLDIRRALDWTELWGSVRSFNPATESGLANLQTLTGWLNGERE